MQVQSVTNFIKYNNYQTKNCNMAKSFNIAPLACDAFTPSVSFKGIKEFREALKNDDAEALRHEIEVNGVDVNTGMGDEYNTPAILYVGRYDRINCFRELRRHPELDMYAEDDDGAFCFMSACFHGYKDIVQDLVDDSDYDINHQAAIRYRFNGLMNACRHNKDEIVYIILQRPDVDLSLKDSHERTATKIARNNGYDSIVKKLEAYVPGVDRRKNVQTPVKTTAYVTKEPQEKQAELAKREAELKNAETALKERKENFEQELKTKAEEIIKEEKAQLEQKLAEVQEKEKSLDNLMNNYKEILAEDIAYARSGFRALYGIKTDEFPEKMGFPEQMTLVINTLIQNRNKLTATDKDTPMNVLCALQDNNEQISDEGLNFIDRVLKVNENKCSEGDLIDAIESVKGDNGLIDMGKAALFLSTLAWGHSTIKAVVQEVKKYGANKIKI